MNCHYFKKHLSRFQDERLETEPAEAMKLHMHQCGACRRLYEEAESVIRLLEILPSPESQPYFYIRLKGCMSAIPADVIRRAWIQRAVLPLMMTVMLLAGMLLGNLAGRLSRTRHDVESDLFTALPLEELQVLATESYTSGVMELLYPNGGGQ